MASVHYRTRDGTADYSFSFERTLFGGWRIYIVSQPDYLGRDKSMHATHRLYTPTGRRYVCWAGKLRTEQHARQVAAVWADKTQEYIRTGRRF